MLGSSQGTLPDKIRVSVGFPSRRALATKNRVIGQCWAGAASEDGVPMILVSPVLKDGLTAAGVLLHELVHAVVGPKEGHKGKFVALAKEVGLVKPWLSALPSDDTNLVLTDIITRVGEFPHAALVPKADGAEGPKKQTARMLKVTCGVCTCPIRMTKIWIDKGLPTCGCGGEMRVEESEGDDQ